jgi:hypothetical protein
MAVLFKFHLDKELPHFSHPGTPPAHGAGVGRVGHLRHRWVGHATVLTSHPGRVR